MVDLENCESLKAFFGATSFYSAYELHICLNGKRGVWLEHLSMAFDSEYAE
jgi:hypothetical protein